MQRIPILSTYCRTEGPRVVIGSKREDSETNLKHQNLQAFRMTLIEAVRQIENKDETFANRALVILFLYPIDLSPETKVQVCIAPICTTQIFNLRINAH